MQPARRARRMVVMMLGFMLAWVAAPAFAQPRPLENIQVFPEDITRGELIQQMRGFSFALGVRCEHCHQSSPDNPDELAFPLDGKDAKRQARFMLRMVKQLNEEILADAPIRDASLSVRCVTCHRGLPTPKTLDVVLTEVIEQDGIEAAVQHYRDLRRDAVLSGTYDFGQWSINELARVLGETDRTEAAIAMLRMNAEFYSESAAIDFQLGALHRTRGEREEAIAAYEQGLEKAPDNRRAREALEELRSGASTPR